MELNNKFNVPSPRKLPREDIATQAVLEKVANDAAQRHSVGTIMTLLDNEGVSLPRSVLLFEQTGTRGYKCSLLRRDFIRSVLAKHAPEGLALRFPGARGGVKRSSLVALGPNYQHHADGHDKVAPQALPQLGGVGLHIYGECIECSITNDTSIYDLHRYQGPVELVYSPFGRCPK